MRRIKIIPLLWLAIALFSGCSALADSQNENKGSPPSPIGIGEQPGPSNPTPSPILPPPLQGDVEIQQLMLSSSDRWETLQIVYLLTSYPNGGSSASPEVQNQQVWIRQPGEFKLEIAATQASPAVTRISDGKSILDSDGNSSDLPASVFEPFIPPNSPSDTVYLHPLAGLIGTPVSDLIFPVGLAQRGGEYRITGKEVVAGRETYVVEWSREPGSLIDRFWVDVETGIILRQQNYGKENSISPIQDIQATTASIDGDLPEGIFDLAQVPQPGPTPEQPPEGAGFVTILPEIMNIRSGPGVDYKVIGTVESGVRLPVIGRRDLGDWWKVQFENQEGWVSSLYVEFSGNLEDIPIVNY